jgi:NDP-sugar pyrophosphorylase family protein
MAHLKKMPTYFVKGEERRAVYYTIDARELIEAGFVEEGAEPGKKIEAHKPKPVPETLVEAGIDAFDTEAVKDEGSESDLEEMTKAELLEFAMERGVDLPNNDRKADILAECRKLA